MTIGCSRIGRLIGLALVAAAAVGFVAACANAEDAKTLAYDGFATSTGAGSYRNHIRLVSSGAATLDVVGFSGERGWAGSTSHFHTRYGRQLKHSMLEMTSTGSLGHWTFNGHRAVGRSLPAAPVAKSGVYTLCLLYLAHENQITKEKATDGHTTNFEGAFAMMGFVPRDPEIDGGARGGNDGQKGLSIGYFEDDLRVFAGGKSFSIIEQYKLGVTYLLMAEMAVSKDGAEHIRAFWAADGDKALTPAKFNEENGGKGVQIETWSSPEDMVRLQLYTQDTQMSPPQASVNDGKKDDFITWDEPRLMDGKAAVPVRHIPDPTLAVVTEPLIAKKELPAKLAAYYAFDEGSGDAAKDGSGGTSDGKLLRAAWIDDGKFGKALHFTTKLGPKGGPHSAGMVTIPHKTAVEADFPWERYHKLTYSAWVRGEKDFSGSADIVTKANGARAEERRFADIKGVAFMIAGNKLELELVNSINYPQPDMRIKVRSKLDVPGDNKWHHVGVTYDGASKPAGVTFYVDGVKDDGFSFDFATLPNQPKELTVDIGTLSPYCVGGRDCNKAEDGVTAKAADYAMDGDIDDVGVYSYVLAPGQVVAVYNLAEEKGLNYNLKQANDLIELHRAKKGTVKVGERTWEYVAGGLAGGLGKVEKKDGKFCVQLGDDGSGVAASASSPTPTPVAKGGIVGSE
ncbi:MAG TPA: LamG-like jellyroll fold domain-containing protein [Phycisphaerae bacterium]|nr:LamG-like jellyroll fold domain-containing protein [Phycisphaerae bacterium]